MSISMALEQEAAAAWKDVGAALGEAWSLLACRVIDPGPLERVLASGDPEQVKHFIDEAKRFAATVRDADFVGHAKTDQRRSSVESSRRSGPSSNS